MGEWAEWHASNEINREIKPFISFLSEGAIEGQLADATTLAGASLPAWTNIKWTTKRIPYCWGDEVTTALANKQIGDIEKADTDAKAAVRKAEQDVQNAPVPREAEGLTVAQRIAIWYSPSPERT